MCYLLWCLTFTKHRRTQECTLAFRVFCSFLFFFIHYFVSFYRARARRRALARLNCCCCFFFSSLAQLCVFKVFPLTFFPTPFKPMHVCFAMHRTSSVFCCCCSLCQGTTTLFCVRKKSDRSEAFCTYFKTRKLEFLLLLPVLCHQPPLIFLGGSRDNHPTHPPTPRSHHG